MEPKPGIPVDSDFDWTQPGALGPGYLPYLQGLQQRDPVFWSRHQNAWIVTRHADIIEGLKDPRLSNHRYHLALEHSAATAPSRSDGDLLKTVRRWIFNTDGADHTRLRMLLMKPFSKASIDRYREPVRANLNSLLDQFAGREQFDFVNEFAFNFVAGSLLEIIGMGHVVTPLQLGEMSKTIVAALVARPKPSDVAAADAVVAALTPRLLSEIEERRRAPREDLLTNFVALSENGDRLSEDDIVGLFQVLMLAAIDTTSYTLSLMMPVLDSSPDYRNYVRANTDRLPAIVEELQRYVGMMNMMHRLATTDFEWHGKQIKAGDMVYFMLAAGNRDPRVYDQPNVLNLERKRQLPLMFAPGLHHCIGHFIAKMELEVALEEIFRRFDRVRVLQPTEYLPNFMTVGFSRLLVRLERAS